MIRKRQVFAVLAVAAVVLTVGIGSQVVRTVQAWPSAGRLSSQVVSIPYAGRLADERGQAVAPGGYDFAFTLYGTELGTDQLWSEVQEGVPVNEGAFAAQLGASQPIPSAILDGRPLWLAVSVRGPEENAFAALTPRQRLSAAAPASPASPANGGACPHDHFGDSWVGNGVGLSVLSRDWIGLLGLGIQGSVLPPAPIGRFGVYGYGDDAGVYGDGPTGVRGTSSAGEGVWGSSGTSVGVHGTSESNVGVFGESITGPFQAPFGAHGVYGIGDGSGVSGRSNHGTGVWGISQNEVGVAGESTSFHGVYGETGGNWGWISGVYGKATQSSANGVTGWNTGAGVGVYGHSETGYAGYFSGKGRFTGVLEKPAGGFKIDHPLDPQHQYLSHSFVESPDMKNVYDGVIVLDEEGKGWVEFPEWFEALNQDFRYQLTPIGAPGPNLYIAQEVQDNRFQIAGGAPGLKVSWQVTGIRHDPFAQAHPIVVEEEKPPEEQGTYLHPLEHGMPETLGLDYQPSREPSVTKP
jgi:hypothetical protein